MYQIKLNKSQKSITLKKVERSVKLVQKLSTIKLQQTGRRGPKGDPGRVNITVGDTPPEDPEVNDIWLDTSV